MKGLQRGTFLFHGVSRVGERKERAARALRVPFFEKNGALTVDLPPWTRIPFRRAKSRMTLPAIPIE